MIKPVKLPPSLKLWRTRKPKMKTKKLSNKASFLSIALAVVLAAGFIVTPMVKADQFDEQIRALSRQNSQIRGQVGTLEVQAADFNDKIAKLQAQIDSLQQEINKSNADIAATEAKIAEAEAELARQKKLLGANIKAMYLEGQISTIEMLASSKDLSDFFDKAQYRSSVKDKIKSTLDKITQLKHELNSQKQILEVQKKDQEARKADVDSQRAEQARLLSLNEADRNSLNTQIKSNSAQIAELHRQQAAINASRRGNSQVITGGACSPRPANTYPDNLCNAPRGSILTGWGWNRECVSYTGWKVYEATGYSPYHWGNANTWDDSARARGFAVDTNPRAGDVAVGHWGPYGHVMYVESVNPNGTINVSQYNWAVDGTYSEMYNYSTAGLVFIHF